MAVIAACRDTVSMLASFEARIWWWFGPYLTGLGGLEERGTVLSGAVVVARATVGSGGVVEISHCDDEASRAADVEEFVCL